MAIADPFHSWTLFFISIVSAATMVACLSNIWAIRKQAAMNSVQPRDLGEHVGRYTAASDKSERLKIGFDYLPESPLANGWLKSNYGSQSMDANPIFKRLIVGSDVRLDMQVKDVFAMDHEIAPNAQLSTHVSYSIKYHKTTMLFFGFKLKSRDGLYVDDRWVKIHVGNQRNPEMVEPWITEYVTWLPGEFEAEGWLKYNLSLEDLVRETWGKDGYSLYAITKVRLRGSLTISPIRLWS